MIFLHRILLLAVLIATIFDVSAASPVPLGKVSTTTFVDHALHTVFDDGNNIFVLTSTLVQPTNYYLNPDGSKTFLRNLHLIKIDGTGSATRLTLGQGANGDAYPSVGALLVDSGKVYAFQNSVQYSSLTDFVLEGFRFTVDATTMVLIDSERVFAGANWGFYPVLYPGPQLMHFSFAGYKRYLDTTLVQYVSPETMSMEYNVSVASQSRGLVLAKEAQKLQIYAPKVIARILARFGGVSPATELANLPGLPPVNLLPPHLHTLGQKAVVPVAMGDVHGLAVDNKGALVSWGGDSLGQLGLGRLINAHSPALVSIAPGFSKIVAGAEHTLALKPDGTLWAWGNNNYGQLGDGSGIGRATPVQVGSGFTAIAAGDKHSLAIKSDGSLWAWGHNHQGQLGDGSQTVRFSPVRVGWGFVALAAGDSHSLALKADGTVWSWGGNDAGQLGDGATISKSTPVQVAGSVVAIVARDHSSFALKTDGSLWAWGANSAGQLGDGSQSDRPSPVRIGSGFSAVAEGWRHTLALKQDGTLWSWGRNFGGQLGDGSTSGHLSPQQIGTNYIAIAAGGAHSLGLQTDGSLWAWGYDVDGVRGLGGASNCPTTTPCRVTSGVVAIAAGSNHSLALKTDGSIFAWGSNALSQLGVGAIGATNQPAPRSVADAVVAVAAGSAHTLAIRSVDGSLWTWGENFEGQLGNGASGFQVYQSSPGRIGGNYVSIAAGQSHSLGLQADGSLWAWGYNYYGQLGDNDWNRKATPVKVGGGYVSMAAGAAHTLAIKSDGSLWAWGNNYFGQLGKETANPRDEVYVPVQVGQGFVAIAAGKWHSLGLKVDGSLWAWGQNQYGQLGNGMGAAGVPSAVPVKIGGQFISIAAGDQHSLGIRADGSLWVWGDNSSGQLGNSNGTTQLNVPVWIGTGFLSIAAGGRQSIGVKADGTVWAWGSNFDGELGDGTYSDRPTPAFVVNKTVDGPLDLIPEVPNNIPADKIPSFLLTASKSGDLSSLGLSARVRLAPVNLNGNALAQANRFAAGCGSGGTCQMFVAALTPAGASTPVCAPTSTSVTESLWLADAQRNWNLLPKQLPAFLSNVVPGPDQTVLMDILSNCDLAGQRGTEFYLGYGEDADEMLKAGRYRVILTVPEE